MSPFWCLVLGLAVSFGCAVRHSGRGVVLRVEPDARRVTVSHEAIPGYMDAMVMPFDVRQPASRELDQLAPGDRMTFRLRVGKQRSWIDRLQVISAPRADAGLLESPARPRLIPIGGPVPAFDLVDQHERPVTLTRLRGQVVAVTFIYTRCPLPDYCPRMLSNFKALAARFPDRIGRDLTLLTVTFDPTYDTPEVLRLYAQAHRADAPGWIFATGTMPATRAICDAFGIEYWPEEGLITHSLQTAVLDRDGRLAGTIEGKDYGSRELGDLIASVLALP